MFFQIEDFQIGIGKEVKLGQFVFVYYIGMLINGFKFDLSCDCNELFEFVFGVGMVIKGWDQGIVGMKVWCLMLCRCNVFLIVGCFVI